MPTRFRPLVPSPWAVGSGIGAPSWRSGRNPCDTLSVARLARKWRELKLVRPARPVLGVQVIERLGDLYRIDLEIGAVLVLGNARLPGESMLPSMTTLATCTPCSEYSSVSTCAKVRIMTLG